MPNMVDVLYNKLPRVYREEDSKSAQNKPLYRFLQILGTGFDAMKADIDNFLNLLDVEHCPDKYLPYIAQSLGIQFPYDMSSQEQRRFILAAPTVYGLKGTIPAFQYLARELTGQQFQATIIENRDWAFKTNHTENRTFTPSQQYGTSSSTVSFTFGPTYNVRSFQLFLTANADTQNLNRTYNRLSQLASYFSPAGSIMLSTIVYYYLDNYNTQSTVSENYLLDSLTELYTETANAAIEVYTADNVVELVIEAYTIPAPEKNSYSDVAVTNNLAFRTNGKFYTNDFLEGCVDVITNVNTGQVTYLIS